MRNHADVALIVLGVLLFAVGSVLLARPFVSRRPTLLVAVPLAAVGGMAAFGLIALVVAAVVALASGAGDGDWRSLFDSLSWPGGGRGRRRK